MYRLANHFVFFLLKVRFTGTVYCILKLRWKTKSACHCR